MRVLGIDPGSRVTGYAVVEAPALQSGRMGALRYVECGVVQPTPGAFAGRLREILAGLREVIAELRPAQVAVEGIFTHRNARSALLLGHARAMALVAAAEAELPVFEYAPATVKLAVTGRGRASKDQVQVMVRALCGLLTTPPPDAADALAIALCHARRATSPYPDAPPHATKSRVAVLPPSEAQARSESALAALRLTRGRR